MWRNNSIWIILILVAVLFICPCDPPLTDNCNRF
jgi:hypothetical protein